jgi:hypothetical protein
VKSERSQFFPLELQGVGTMAVESMRSYVQRLALAHRLNPTTLLGLLVETTPLDSVGCSQNAYRLTQHWHLHGASGIGQQLADRLSTATTVDLSSSTLARFSSLFSPVGLATTRGVAHYCPACVQQVGDDGLPYGRLLWLVGGIRACPQHRVRLRDSASCGAPVSARLERRCRPSLEGVCGQCGSIGFQCLKEQELAPATDIEVWEAEQVSRLLSLGPSSASEVSSDALRQGLREVLDARFDGKAVNASLEAGLARSVVWSWVEGKFKPTLAGLLKFCAQARCEMVEMIGGRYVRSREIDTSGSPVRRRAYRKNVLTDDEIRERIRGAAAMEPPMSGVQLAHSLQIDSKLLRTRYRAEYESLMDAGRRHSAEASQARYADFERRMTAAVDALRVKGKSVNRKSIRLEAGISTYSATGNARKALEVVMQRLGSNAEIL